MEIGNSLQSKINLAGVNFDANAVILKATCTGPRYSTFEDSEENSYQVPVGKTLRIRALQIMRASASDLGIGYGDTNVGFDSAAAPTNDVKYANSLDCLKAGAGNLYEQAQVIMDVPEGKYPRLYVSTANLNNVLMIGELI